MTNKTRHTYTVDADKQDKLMIEISQLHAMLQMIAEMGYEVFFRHEDIQVEYLHACVRQARKLNLLATEVSG